MSTVVCKQECKYRKAMFCGLNHIMLNDYGQCRIWWFPNGTRRAVPDYGEIEPAPAKRKD